MPDQETEDVEAWERDFQALDSNPGIFEWFCERCRNTAPASKQKPSTCLCGHPEIAKVFVGKTPHDGDAWGAAGTLLDLVERAAKVIKAMGDQLDQEHAREMRDEDTIEALRKDRDVIRLQRDMLESAVIELREHMAKAPAL